VTRLILTIDTEKIVIDINNISRHIFTLLAQIYKSSHKQKTPQR